MVVSFPPLCLPSPFLLPASLPSLIRFPVYVNALFVGVQLFVAFPSITCRCSCCVCLRYVCFVLGFYTLFVFCEVPCSSVMEFVVGMPQGFRVSGSLPVPKARRRSSSCLGIQKEPIRFPDFPFQLSFKSC